MIQISPIIQKSDSTAKMEFPQEVKTALNQLPPAERVVALALKNIFNQIKSIHDEEQKEIDASHMGFISRFKQIEVKTSKIVNGQKLTKEDLANPETYFLEEEKADLEKGLQNTEPLKDYWFTVFKNSNLNQQMEEVDDKIFSHLTDLSTNVTTETIQLQFTFKENEYLPACTLKRMLKFDNGAAIDYTGDKIALKQAFPQECLANRIFNDTSDAMAIADILGFINYVANQLVPYSLEFYLGGADVDEDEEFDEDNEEDDEEDEEQQGQKGGKKSKPN